jgi:hypothetical protein
MPDFQDIIEQNEALKKTPGVTDLLRQKKNISKGLAADSLQKRQQYLPDKETHARLQDKLSTMFDKTSRAGAKSSLHGLIMPGGRKMFTEFHDTYTGTGRYTPQKTPDKVVFDDKAPKVDPYPNKVILYERCAECCERVDMNNFIPAMTFIPAGEHLNPIARAKWAVVDIKPGTLICYLFCMSCPADSAAKLKKIKHDAVKSQFIIGMGPDGKPWTAADKECQEFLHVRTDKINDNIFTIIKQHRELKSNDIFYGNARID